jgi:hypothetical protein
MGFVVDKVALGQVYSEYLGFPFQFSFHRLLHTHHFSYGAGKIGQLVAEVPSGIRKKKKKTVKNVDLWDVAPCRSSGLNRHFEGTYRLHLQGRKILERRNSVSRWLEAIGSSETSVHSIRSTRRHIPEDGILHSHRRENIKSYKKKDYLKAIHNELFTRNAVKFRLNDS